MKRLLIVLAFLLAPAANASPELAETWGVRASSLYEDTSEMLDALMAGYAPEVPDDYAGQLTQFAVTATRLGYWIDNDQGPSDYGCIFRGMAEEAELQLYALEKAEEFSSRRAALKRLATMLDDAQVIAVASAHSMQTGASDISSAMSCPASSAMGINIALQD